MKVKRVFSLLLVFILCVCCVGCNKETSNEPTQPNVQVGLHEAFSPEKEYKINLYYYDANMWSYLYECVQRFKVEYPNVEINLVNAIIDGYVEKLVDNNTTEYDVADVYMLPTTHLEKAYLAGITTENMYGEYTEENYAARALDACTFNGKLVAYPLSFNTQIMVYNTMFKIPVPANFEEMKNNSNDIEIEEGQVLEHILNWDLSDMTINYNFVGNTMSICGDNGDDRTSLVIDDLKVVNSLQYFADLTTFYNISRDSVTTESVLKSFNDGKTVFALINSNDIKNITLKDADGNKAYEVHTIPNMDVNNDVSGLAETVCMVVNPYSQNVEAGKVVAKFFTHDTADLVHEKTPGFSTRKLTDAEGNEYSEYKAVYMAYEKSVLKVRLMDIGNFYMKLEIAFHNIANGGDIAEELKNLQQYAVVLFAS